MTSASSDRVASLYFGDLHLKVSEVLYDKFIPFGLIHSTRVCRDRNTFRSLGYGFVNFVNHFDAEHAMDMLMFDLLMGQPMRISWADKNPALRISGVGNIFIQGLAKDIDSLALHNTFSHFGTILSCKVVADENGSKGYGFVHYETYEAAERAILKLNGMLLNDQLVSISHYRSFQERQVEKANHDRVKMNYKSLFPGVHLYVNNLPYSWTDQQLHRVFSTFATITNAKVARNGSCSRGFSFVCFTSPEAAAQAITAMNGRVIANRRLNVTFSRVMDQDTPLSVSDCESPPAVQDTKGALLPFGHFGAVVPQANSNAGQQFTSHIQFASSSCLQEAASLLPKCENLVLLVTPLLIDSVMLHSIDAPETSDTFGAITDPLSGDFGAVVTKAAGHLTLVLSRHWNTDGVSSTWHESLLPLLTDMFDSESPCMLTVNQEESEMTPDQTTGAPGTSDPCSDVALIHHRFGNGLGNRNMSISKVMVVMDGDFVLALCCSPDDTTTVILRIQEDLLLHSKHLLFYNTAGQMARRTFKDASRPRLAIQGIHPESDQIVVDAVRPSAQVIIKPVFTTLMQKWSSLHKTAQTLHISTVRADEVNIMTRADIQQNVSVLVSLDE